MILKGFGTRGVSVEQQLQVEGVTDYFIPKTRQIHSDIVTVVTSQLSDLVVEADAFITTEPNVVCAVQTADCVPLLIWDARERVVSAVHAGWRGIASEIVPQTVAFIRARFFDADLRVTMGPAMAASCYEVGDDVVLNCARTVSDIAMYLHVTRPGHHRIDLKGVLTEQLERAGITFNCIEDSAICTHCNPNYASYRRGDRQERQFSWIMIT